MCAEGKAAAERKGLTMKERLKICEQTERRRITFGKVPGMQSASLYIVKKKRHCVLLLICHAHRSIPLAASQQAARLELS